MTDNVLYIPVETLRSFIKDVLLCAQVPPEDAEVCSDVIITSDIRGIESHGISRLKYYYQQLKNGQFQVNTPFEVVRESPTTAVVDGHYGLGMVIAKKAMQLAIDKAKAFGMGSVAVRNSNHFGIAGYYPLMAVRQGLVGFTVTNARPTVAPTFGVQPMLGTNPISFGAPTDEDIPFLYDGSTPIAQRGRIEVLARAGKPVPEGWLIDQQGQPVTDAAAAVDGFFKQTVSFLPLGGAGELMSGHKGYGFGTIVEILSASFQNGAFLLGLFGEGPDGRPQPYKTGHFFMALNVESFTSLEEFKKTTGQILRDLRGAKKVPGHDRIYTAGEKEYENEKRTRAQGIPLIPNLQKEIKYLQNELGLTQYEFPF